MDVQQISVKIFAEPGHSVGQSEYIPVFHKWIREKRIANDKLLIDVADYKHVHHGPGIMIVGHEAHWSMDEGGGELGLFWHRKRDELGPAQPKLQEALRDVTQAALALQDEPTVAGRLSFSPQRLLFRITSKLAAENNEANRAAWQETLTTFLGSVAPGATLSFDHDTDARNCVGATVTLSGGPELKALHAAVAG